MFFTKKGNKKRMFEVKTNACPKAISFISPGCLLIPTNNHLRFAFPLLIEAKFDKLGNRKGIVAR